MGSGRVVKLVAIALGACALGLALPSSASSSAETFGYDFRPLVAESVTNAPVMVNGEAFMRCTLPWSEQKRVLGWFFPKRKPKTRAEIRGRVDGSFIQPGRWETAYVAAIADDTVGHPGQWHRYFALVAVDDKKVWGPVELRDAHLVLGKVSLAGRPDLLAVTAGGMSGGDYIVWSQLVALGPGPHIHQALSFDTTGRNTVGTGAATPLIEAAGIEQLPGEGGRALEITNYEGQRVKRAVHWTATKPRVLRIP